MRPATEFFYLGLCCLLGSSSLWAASAQPEPVGPSGLPLLAATARQRSLPGPKLPAPPTPRRDPRFWPRGYYPGDPLPPRTVYLTFDDGPSDFTAQILDILKAEGVQATFFINAFDRAHPAGIAPGLNYLSRYQETLRRMVREGHVIGNHSYTHPDFATLSRAQIEFQLSTLESQLRAVLGAETPVIHLIRPPFGSPWLGNWNSDRQRSKVRDILEPRGLVMLWTIGWDSSDGVDWAGGEWFTVSGPRYHPGGPAYERKMERELDRILRRATMGASGVLLMHDTHPTSRDILKTLIEELKARGYRFGTLEDYCRWRWGPEVFDPAS